MSQQFILQGLSHNPLGGESFDTFASRKPILGRIMHNVLFYESGCYLLSGQRGSGKTTLVNQLIYQLENLTDPATQQLVAKLIGTTEDELPFFPSVFTVKVDISKEYDETALLERILRQVTTKFISHYQLAGDFRENLNLRVGEDLALRLLEYVEDSKQRLDYKQSASVAFTHGGLTTLGLQVSGAVTAEVGQVLSKFGVSGEVAPELVRQINRQIERNISTEARDYSIESLEAQLLSILSSLRSAAALVVSTSRAADAMLTYGDIASAVSQAVGQDTITARIQDIAKTIKRTVHQAVVQTIKGLLGSEKDHSMKPFDRVLIVIDDTDKAGYVNAVKTLNNLRGMFQSSEAFFLFVGSEEFYENWYSYSAPGVRSEIDSVFHNVFYLPPLSISEAGEMLRKLIIPPAVLKKRDTAALEWYSKVLLFVSQGFPRQLVRTLDLISIKQFNGTLKLDSAFFEAFNANGYQGIISRFVSKYTSYRDPRYEKCLYVGLMILSGTDTMTRGELRTYLEQDETTRRYSPVIHARVLTDVIDIVSPRANATSVRYRINPTKCLLLSRSKNESYGNIARYLLDLIAIGESEIATEDIRAYCLLNRPGQTNEELELLKTLQQYKALSPYESHDEIPLTLGDGTFVIGPREILAIAQSELTLQQIAVQQKVVGNVHTAGGPTQFRQFLLESPDDL